MVDCSFVGQKLEVRVKMKRLVACRWDPQPPAQMVDHTVGLERMADETSQLLHPLMLWLLLLLHHRLLHPLPNLHHLQYYHMFGETIHWKHFLITYILIHCWIN